MPPIIRTVLETVVGLVVVAILWAIAAPIAVSYGAPPFAVPSPGPVLLQAYDLLASADFRRHLLASIAVFGQGFGPGVVAGVVIGLAARYSAALRWVFGPLIVTIAAAPLIAFVPLFITWIGLGNTPKLLVVYLITASAVGNAVMFVRNTQTAVPAAGGGARPAAPNHTYGLAIAIMAGLRTGVILSIMALIASEMLASTSGIGHFIATAMSTFEITKMMAAIVVLTVPTVLLTAFLQAIEEQIAA